eukprot:TRINITY_DN2960_c0_g1_i3.p1 TRINITY_DN2960_c0_g1~~TRINITY_DN2960_c0_g1_i3.p1  ORF type:complete len:867 (+),score=235.05 TRINITY_DN2960_c0_g1_i3:271-2601(+)
MSIIIENLKSVDSLYFFLSNDHINNMITHAFDFCDEETTAQYISFLKTLSLKLDSKSVHFFFNEEEQTFPLFTEAIRWFDYRNSMVRIAVRVLTLNVLKVEDPRLQDYLRKRVEAYFESVVKYTRKQCFALSELFLRHAAKDNTNHCGLDLRFSEVVDMFYYMQDLFSVNWDALGRSFCKLFLENCVLSQIVGSLLHGTVLEDRLNPVVALLLLAQLFSVIRFPPLVNTLGDTLFHPDAQLQLHDGDGALVSLTGTLLEFLADDLLLFASMLLLLAFVKNPVVDKTLLEEASLLPFQKTKTKHLLDFLTDTNEDGDSNDIFGGGSGHAFTVAKHSQQHPWCIRVRFESNSPPSPASARRSDKTPSPSPLLSPSSDDDASALFGLPLGNKPTFYEQLLDALFDTLDNSSNRFRAVTLQLVSMMIKELVCAQDAPPRLTAKQKSVLAKAYRASMKQLQEMLCGKAGQIFIELFEHVHRSLKSLDFDRVITAPEFALPEPFDFRSLPLLVSRSRLSPEYGATCCKTIERFLVLRDLKLTFEKRKEDTLPLKAPETAKIAKGEPFPIDPSIQCIPFRLLSDNGDPQHSLPPPTTSPQAEQQDLQQDADAATAADADKQHRFMTVVPGLLLVLGNPTPIDMAKLQQPPQPQVRPSAPGTRVRRPTKVAVVETAVPLDTLDVDCSDERPNVLLTTSLSTTWSAHMDFLEPNLAVIARQLIEKGRTTCAPHSTQTRLSHCAQRAELQERSDAAPAGHRRSTQSIVELWRCKYVGCTVRNTSVM